VLSDLAILSRHVAYRLSRARSLWIDADLWAGVNAVNTKALRGSQLLKGPDIPAHEQRGHSPLVRGTAAGTPSTPPPLVGVSPEPTEATAPFMALSIPK
jgi:hypothetical protein